MIMKHIRSIIKRGLSTSFLCLMAVAFTLPAHSGTGRPKSGPDFAFPQTVSKEASAQFDKALKERDGREALISAIRIDIADALVSSSSFLKSAERFDSVASIMTSPWNALAYLLEAKMYSQLYRTAPWKFNSRKLPVSPVPDDVMEWSGDMFADKVNMLSGKTLDLSASLSDVPISEISDLLTDCNDAVKDGFSVLDFITLQLVDILSPFIARNEVAIIPFGGHVAKNSETNFSSSIILLFDRAIDRNRNKNNTAVASFFMERKMNFLSGQESLDFAKSCYEELKDTPYCVPFLLRYSSSLTNPDIDDISCENICRRKQYDLLSSYLTKFPNAREIASVEQSLESLREKWIEVSSFGKMIPNQTDSVTVRGANIFDFNVLIYSLPIKPGEIKFEMSDIRTKGKLQNVINVKIEGNEPDKFEQRVEIPPLTPGCYAFVPSTTKNASGIIGQKEHYPLSVTLVTGINILNSYSHEIDGQDIFVVSASNNKPVSGANVTVQEKNRNGGVVKTAVYKTDNEGKVSIPFLRYDYLVEYNGNKLAGSFYNYSYINNNARQVHTSGNILTDLGIYHPDDTVKFVGVVFNSFDRQLQACTDKKISIKLYDANYQLVDSCRLTTDAYGRLNGEFILPQKGLLGSWHISLMDGNNTIATRYFDMAEYKQPSFIVDVTGAEGNVNIGDVLTFNGNVLTYTGMPVSDARVSYEVEYVPLWFSRKYITGEYSGTSRTDSNGNFTIVLDTEGLRDTDYQYGMFFLTCSVTDNAGETQSSHKVRFSIGEGYRIVPRIPDKINASAGKMQLNVNIYDVISHPVEKNVNYEIERNKEILEKGEFTSPTFTFDPTRFESGEYIMRFTEGTDTVSRNVLIWRNNDKMPPVKTLLWVDSTKIISPKGAKFMKIRIGSSYPDHFVLAQICNSKEILGYKWIEIKDGFAYFVVDSPADNEQIFVNLVGTDSFSKENETIRIIPYIQTVSLLANIETFRDRIAPGDKETWKFSFKLDGQIQPSLPVMAVMTDKSINSLKDNTWWFNPYANLNWSSISNLQCFNRHIAANLYQLPSGYKYSSVRSFAVPEWQLYGYSLLGAYASTRLYMKSAARSSAAGARPDTELSVTSNGYAESFALAEDSAVMEESSDAGGIQNLAVVANENGEEDKVTSEDDKEKSQLRDTNIAVAFFEPNLVTDADGIASIEFEAPNFVGTWMFQILGYTPDMKGTVMTLDAVSTKKVMAVLNAPRFARTGDRLNVAGNVFNNSDSEQLTTGRIEFVNPVTGDVLYAYSPASSHVNPAQSMVIDAEWKVPSDIEVLAIRIYGEIPGYKDGEQVIIPILPSSTPVIESIPFYLASGENEFSLILPKFEEDSRITLTYCDNPVWECVTALPSLLKAESINILAQTNALFGNCVALGLFTKYPVLAEGIQKMTSANQKDSLLFSPLEKDMQLKTVILNNTPWVNNASAESIRMQSLIKYTDREMAGEEINQILTLLGERQLSDGGWGWCPEMKSSVYITSYVFAMTAQLQNMGYLPVKAAEMSLKAAKYIDNALAEDWNRTKRKSFSMELLIDYLYSKSAFKGMKSTSSFAPLEKEALRVIESDWRKLDIYHKATAAILLERMGRTKTSRLILESLRQYASESKEKGMWFDNLKSGWSGMNTLLTTARVLKAFSSIEPDNPAVDRIRQWLVVSKQVQNWGDNTMTVAVINAILSSGTDWTHASESPEVSLNGMPLSVDNITNVAGSFTINLPSSEASDAVLAIRRSASGPAWGGVIAQYIAPIQEVKAASVPQLSIKKNVYFLSDNDKAQNSEMQDMKVGDKAKVTLTIVSDRDIEYVAITDPRAACLEPVDQISGYTSSDGVWFYREVRNESTNIFIPFLSKGAHSISYDCFVDRRGEYSLGVVNAQSQYAPAITAHSAGKVIKVDN